MHAFISLGAVKQATLQMVAPGIAEALIATAIGLFAAIPAVMAYNRLNQHVNSLNKTMTTSWKSSLLFCIARLSPAPKANK